MSQTLIRMVVESHAGEKKLAAISDALDLIQLCVDHRLGSAYTVRTQGSYQQGLLLETSDLDVVICTPSKMDLSKRECIEILTDVCEFLVDYRSMRLKQRIFGARVPIARFMANMGASLLVDVSAGPQSRGLCDIAVRKLVWSDGTGYCSALCRLVKLWTKAHPETVDTHNGGISSFGWVLLTIFHLQQRGLVKPLNRTEENFRPPGFDHLREDLLLSRLADLFAFLASIRLRQPTNLSVTTGKASPFRDNEWALFVEVPTAPEQNATRCLKESTWNSSILPALQAARRTLAFGRDSGASVAHLFGAQAVATELEEKQRDKKARAEAVKDAAKAKVKAKKKEKMAQNKAKKVKKLEAKKKKKAMETPRLENMGHHTNVVSGLLAVQAQLTASAPPKAAQNKTAQGPQLFGGFAAPAVASQGKGSAVMKKKLLKTERAEAKAVKKKAKKGKKKRALISK